MKNSDKKKEMYCYVMLPLVIENIIIKYCNDYFDCGIHINYTRFCLWIEEDQRKNYMCVKCYLDTYKNKKCIIM